MWPQGCCCLQIPRDSVILRFLKARDFNVEKGREMLCHSLAWRKLHGIDRLLSTYKPPPVIQNYYAGGWHYHDRGTFGNLPISIPSLRSRACSISLTHLFQMAVHCTFCAWGRWTSRGWWRAWVLRASCDMWVHFRTHGLDVGAGNCTVALSIRCLLRTWCDLIIISVLWTLSHMISQCWVIRNDYCLCLCLGWQFFVANYAYLATVGFESSLFMMKAHELFMW